MHIGNHRIFLQLCHRELLCAQVERALLVECLEGAIWVTQHHCTADLILLAGQRATLVYPGTAVLAALMGSKVSLSTTPPRRPAAADG